MTGLTIVSAIVVALLFLGASASKLRSNEASVAMRTHLGVPAPIWKLIGVAEIFGAIGVLVGLAFTPLGIAAAGGLAALAVGAVVSHVRVGDSLKAATLAILGLALALATGSLFLV